MKKDDITLIVHDHFDALADQYDTYSSVRNKYLLAINRFIVRRIKQEGLINGKILDIGCGTGTRAKAIFSAMPKIEVYGSDISTKMLAIASTKGLSGLIRCDMSFLPFQNESFDAITCLFNVIGYLGIHAQRVKAFQEFNRVLRSNGLLFVDFMNRWHLGEGLNFRRSILVTWMIYIRSLFPDFQNQGNQYFNLTLNGKNITGFVHGFSHREIQGLLSEGKFNIVDDLVIGYDSGELKRHRWQGQYFFIARKTQEKTKEVQS